MDRKTLTAVGALLATGIVGLLCCGPVRAEDPPADIQTTLEALKQRIRDQDRRIAELESRTDPGAVERARREEVTKLIRQMKERASDLPSLPKWMDGLKFSGDFRLRYQGDCYNWGSTPDARQKTRNRARFRLRAGLAKSWLDDQLQVVFRLASGSDNDPTSTNQTFTGNFSDKPVWIDLAYAQYTPKALKGLKIVGGKIINPWRMNEIFVDSDVNPEGFWAEYKVPGLGPVEPFVGAGYFILGDSSSAYDTIQYGVQGGLNWNITEDVRYEVAAYWQDYDHYDTSGAAARGNDVLARVPAFGVVGLSNGVHFKVCDLPVHVFFDWAHNCAEEDALPHYEDAADAFAAGVKVGKNKKKGDWSAAYRYGYVMANSLPGNFVDSDFGFANRKGHILRASYNLLDSLTVGVNVLLTDPIFSPKTGGSFWEDRTVTVQADLVWKF